ncbi:MAG: hypothetical protein WDA75_12160 [Candidatus Latescibacterota bacterium]
MNATITGTQPRTRTSAFDRALTGLYLAHLFILYAAGCALAVFVAAQHLA